MSPHDAPDNLPAGPDGWLAVARSGDLGALGVISRTALGRNLVIWRTEDGEAHCSDAECPHMGADMGRGGKVVDDGFACPIHGLRFDRTGRCMPRHPGKQAPGYSIRTYPLWEQSGVIYLWTDPERRPASAPRMAERVG